MGGSTPSNVQAGGDPGTHKAKPYVAAQAWLPTAHGEDFRDHRLTHLRGRDQVGHHRQCPEHERQQYGNGQPKALEACDCGQGRFPNFAVNEPGL